MPVKLGLFDKKGKLSFLTVNVSYPWEVHVLLNISIALWGSSHPVSFVSLLITTIEFISLYLIKYQHLTSIIFFLLGAGGSYQLHYHWEIKFSNISSHQPLSKKDH